MNRRHFIAFSTYGTAAAILPGALQTATARADDDTVWHNVQAWGVEGKGWPQTARYYDRLPATARFSVRDPVWGLSRHSAGMCVQFETDATDIFVRYALLSEDLALPHMPATGVSGLDLYASNEEGQFRWVAVVKPVAQHTETPLAKGLALGRRAYMLYLPLYNGIDVLEIGISKQASFEPMPPRTAKPIVFYGTSIIQGACASRPGIASPSILGRRLSLPIVNLGFSGNGIMEPEVGALLSELDPSVYVIDCLPNMDAMMIAERAVPLVKQLRRARPDTPIVLVEDVSYTAAPFIPERQQRNDTRRAAFQRAAKQLVDEGMDQLYYVEGGNLLGKDAEGTTDGIHPNDLGMMRYADGLEPVLKEALRARSAH